MYQIYASVPCFGKADTVPARFKNTGIPCRIIQQVQFISWACVYTC